MQQIFIFMKMALHNLEVTYNCIGTCAIWDGMRYCIPAWWMVSHIGAGLCTILWVKSWGNIWLWS